jgi:peptidoglycan hydrolase-like protein with peptidoglycan-binding domain
MFSWAKKKGMDWGTIDTLPEILVWRCIRTVMPGYYTATAMRGVAGLQLGCVKTQVKKRPWTHWYKLPFIDYGDTSGAQVALEAVTVYTLGSRLLKNGSSGADVKALQELLNQLGATLEADGQFGSKTEAAVRAFRRKPSQAGRQERDQTHSAQWPLWRVRMPAAGQTESTSLTEQNSPSPGRLPPVLIKSAGGKSTSARHAPATAASPRRARHNAEYVPRLQRLATVRSGADRMGFREFSEITTDNIVYSKGLRLWLSG